MKIILNLIITILSIGVFAQQKDSTVSRRITTITWMPEGNEIILNIMKIEKYSKLPPISEKYIYNLKEKKLKALDIEGSGFAVSPDGKSIAFLKFKDNNIYLYDIGKKTDRLLVKDTIRKHSICWSPEGTKIAYNFQVGTSSNSSVEIAVYSLSTKEIKQITNSGKYKSYSPSWNPVNNKIIYFLEKGDLHDQIYLTDSEGSFHTNLSNDSTSNDNFPSWIDENNIVYIYSRNNIVTMDINTYQSKKVEGIHSIAAKYNISTGKIAYLDKENKLMIYTLKDKSSEMILNEPILNDLLSK